MKEFYKKLISGILLATLTSTIFCGCESRANADTPTHQDLSTADYRAQAEFYAELVSSLQEQIINIKEESFIAECEYKQRIEDLEESIKTLSDKIGYISAGNTESRPTDSEPSTFVGQSNTEKALTSTDLALKNDFLFEETSSGIILTRYTGSECQVTIPSQIGGLPVTAIGDEAFKDTKITSISVPDSVKEIGWFAFSGCSLLAKIHIPASVMSIGYGAFDLCPEAMLIKCESGSYAEAYSISWGIRFSAE